MRVKLLHKKNKGLIALATIASLFMSCDKKKNKTTQTIMSRKR